jgi:hypothetical protein
VHEIFLQLLRVDLPYIVIWNRFIKNYPELRFIVYCLLYMSIEAIWTKKINKVIFSSTFRRKKVELLSSLRRQRLGRLSFRLSFLSESISQKLSKVSIWNLDYLFTIKRGINYNKALLRNFNYTKKISLISMYYIETRGR